MSVIDQGYLYTCDLCGKVETTVEVRPPQWSRIETVSIAGFLDKWRFDVCYECFPNPKTSKPKQTLLRKLISVAGCKQHSEGENG